MQFDRLSAAQAHLASLGMVYSYVRGPRQYWKYFNKKDVFLDHSATITMVGEVYHVSVF